MKCQKTYVSLYKGRGEEINIFVLEPASKSAHVIFKHFEEKEGGGENGRCEERFPSQAKTLSPPRSTAASLQGGIGTYMEETEE